MPGRVFHVERDRADDVFLRVIAAAQQRLVADPSPTALQAHLEDARTGLALLDGETGLLIDVGSGAGFPGIPLLNARPDLRGVLLESRARRCDHLRDAIQACDLAERVRVAHARAENYAVGPDRAAADIAVARALAPPPVALEVCVPLVRPGGVVLLYTGSVDRLALAATAEALGAVVERIEPTRPDESRLLVRVRRTGPLPEGVPRPAARARRRPLVRPAG